MASLRMIKRQFACRQMFRNVIKLSEPTLAPSLYQLQPRANSVSLASTKKILEESLSEIKNAGTWKAERIIVSKQGAKIGVKGQTNSILNFCANNYLGLSAHPEVIEASKKALDTHGAGLSSVRFICGTQNIHRELEEKLASFHGREDAILYASCFDANAGIFEVLLSPEDAVISDELNHASIIDGIRLCKAQRHRYLHKNMEDLEKKLQETSGARQRLIVTDGAFSMDGNVAPLIDICDLADKYNAIVFIDECHATGFFGKTGRGTEEYHGIEGRVDIINSTLGKALGGAAGGYTTGPKALIDLLRQRSRPYLFSNTLPPPVVASASKSLDLIMQDDSLTGKVLSNTKRFRTQMVNAGFTMSGDPDHPICPVMLGDARLASIFADKMLEQGIYVIGFSYPVVPIGKARIRVQISAAHSEEDIDRAVSAFINIGRELKVVS
ncbi:2-amino-3-ketobutyrate coenzyme A ligase, mitochondrial isoform X1 [Octopus bimaculoides]|uniref:2-amino-3-ketobutyrate coenzyme A ligase, mitochondrial n=1 Tax=Octopus bimaculoides TaxID=37653 RepID=A0A0L8H8T1_OCTBM|nr:2-amino-3-ketobutyrate coenzyme A ligase, mitochondrial isoform X1 [Octopus bimaculoides]|eukprot:XP_014774821.1 PREDICTED: 2-amino-3-ketobutyrate coenzyme A ligase, mitochondrial-like isoform X1 [Octopus bimaculoides]